MKLKTGDKVWFPGEKRPYKVRARNNRYVICTKPFNLKQTVLYTIIDLLKGVRGTENLIFCMGFETDEQCRDALLRLINGESEISRQNRAELDIERIENAVNKKK